MQVPATFIDSLGWHWYCKCPDLEKIKCFLSIYHNSTTIRLLCTTASPSILSHDISWMKISIKDYHLPDFNRLKQECLKEINKKFEDPSISSKIEDYLCSDTNQCKWWSLILYMIWYIIITGHFSLLTTHFSILMGMPTRGHLYKEL